MNNVLHISLDVGSIIDTRITGIVPKG